MSQVLTPGLKVSGSCQVRKLRELPVTGKTIAKLGQHVTSTDVVAEAELPGELHILRVAEKMTLDPQEVLQGLKIKLNDCVEQGQVICQHSGLFGLFSSKFISPVSGQVEFITERTGHIGVRGASRKIQLLAWLEGVVSAVDEGKSIAIESRAALMQGIFGVGGEKVGVVRMLQVDPDVSLEIQDLPENCTNLVLVGGTNPSASVLREASKRGAVGLVTGAIDDTALKEYLGYDLGIALTGDEDVSMTLILTEGFGKIPISNRVINLLKNLDGKRAAITGATQVRAGALRPELIVVHSDQGQSVGSDFSIEGNLDIGSKIRIIRVPYFGRVAEVTGLPRELMPLDSGSYARVLKAKLEDGTEVVIPRANIELI